MGYLSVDLIFLWSTLLMLINKTDLMALGMFLLMNQGFALKLKDKNIWKLIQTLKDQFVG